MPSGTCSRKAWSRSSLVPGISRNDARLYSAATMPLCSLPQIPRMIPRGKAGSDFTDVIGRKPLLFATGDYFEVCPRVTPLAQTIPTRFSQKKQSHLQARTGDNLIKG